MTTTAQQEACDCWFCYEYEDVKCDACGTAIIPACKVIRIRGHADADLCRSCIGAGFSDQINRLMTPIAAKQAAIALADLAYVTAHDVAVETFWAATAEQAKAYDATRAAARQAYRDATGEVCMRVDSLHRRGGEPWSADSPF